MHPGFAFLDFETTGLSPKSHRIIEIAILRTDAWGRELGELSTLVDPERSVEATEIHGITNADVREAPTFRDIAGTVCDFLRGAVLVSHNHRFDRRFLLRELERIGHGGVEPVGLCTMALADDFLDRAWGRSLKACCDAGGVRLENWHHALSDARATAGLFTAYMKRGGAARSYFSSELEAARHVQWPMLAARRELVPRSLAQWQRENRPSHVASLVHRLPAGASANPDAEAYLAKLDEVLEDRIVTPAEGAALEELARELGLASGDLPRLHFNYLRDLARFAIADRRVSPEERADLTTVARLLGFPGTAADAALEAAANAAHTNGIADRRPLEKGMLVCFSETDRDRDTLESAAAMAGLVVRTVVSKKTDVVVTSDPLSKSAKLEKARTLGKRILLESLFVAMVNDMHARDGHTTDSAPAVSRGPGPRPDPTSAGASSSAQASGWPPGWYADPWGKPCFRYWDGRGWTGNIAGSWT